MTEEIERTPAAPLLPRCPYLGTLKDKNVFTNSPSHTNFCHKSVPGAFPAFALQKKICLSPVFTQCPVFNNPNNGKIPDELRWKGPLSLEGGILGWVTIPVLAMGFALLFIIVGLQNNWWRELPMSSAGPLAGETIPGPTQPAAFVFPAVTSALPTETASTQFTATLMTSPTGTPLPFFLRLFPRTSTPTPTPYGYSVPIPPLNPSLTHTTTPNRTFTFTPPPTSTAVFTRTPKPTRTPFPTSSFTPTPTFTPTFTFTPSPTPTLPLPSDTLAPTPTPTLENTPKPTPTHKSTNTPRPSNTPKPTPTPSNTPDPNLPTPTPQPTGSHD